MGTIAAWMMASFAFGQAPTAAAHPLLGDPAKGQEVFTTFCVVCHGETGQGDGPTAASLDPKPRNFTDPEIMHSLEDSHLLEVIANGGASVGKSPLMPAWKGPLNKTQIADVAAFVRTLAPIPAEG